MNIRTVFVGIFFNSAFFGIYAMEGPEVNLIQKTKYFSITLYVEDQRVPRVVMDSFAPITTNEQEQELMVFLELLNRALKKAFNAYAVNIIFKNPKPNELQEKPLHWHFVPRLSSSVKIINSETNEQHIFEDPCYGKPYDSDSAHYKQAYPSVISKIIQKIQSVMPEIMQDMKKNLTCPEV